MVSPAQARQWVVFFNNSTTTSSLDVDSIKGEGNIRDFWVKSVHQEEETMGYVRYSSSLKRSWVNCYSRKIGSSNLTLYSIQGRPVYSAKEDEPANWSSVLPTVRTNFRLVKS